MDECDMSQARMEAEQERLLAARRWTMLPAIGECHNCQEQLVDDKRFCDRHCVQDWEQRQAANNRNGRG